MESTSSNGLSVVQVTLDYGTSLDDAKAALQSEVTGMQLPEGADPQVEGTDGAVFEAQVEAAVPAVDHVADLRAPARFPHHARLAHDPGDHRPRGDDPGPR